MNKQNQESNENNDKTVWDPKDPMPFVDPDADTKPIEIFEVPASISQANARSCF